MKRKPVRQVKRKLGRPKAKQAKSIIKCFRLTKEEARELDESGLSLSEICREAVHKKAARAISCAK